MTLKAIFFDMDGVLVLSEPLHICAWKELLKLRKIEVTDVFKDGAYTGVSDNVIAYELAKKIGLNDSPETLLIEKQRIFLAMLDSTELEVPPHRDGFLKECRNRYQIALVSSSSRTEVEAILRKENLNSIFDIIITGADVNTHKPSPEPYLLALKKAGIAANEAIVIEDSATGIAASQEAGISAITFMGSFEDLFNVFMA